MQNSQQQRSGAKGICRTRTWSGLAAAYTALFLARRYARPSDFGCLSGISTQQCRGGAAVGGAGRHWSPCRLAWEGRERIVRSRGTAELQLPTRAAVDAVDEELLPRSIRERRRAMRNANSLSSSADEHEESAASFSQSIELESLPAPFPAMVEGRG